MTGIAIMIAIILSHVQRAAVHLVQPDAQNLNATLLGPSAHHLLGTDQPGRDTWTRLLYGRRGHADRVLAVLFPFTLGIILGSLAGYSAAGSTP